MQCRYGIIRMPAGGAGIRNGFCTFVSKIPNLRSGDAYFGISQIIKEYRNGSESKED